MRKSISIEKSLTNLQKRSINKGRVKRRNAAKKAIIRPRVEVLFTRNTTFRKENKMELSKERLLEIAYPLLIMVLSNQEIKFNPQQFKRKLGNLPGELRNLPKEFGGISEEELQAALKKISHDLVDFAFDFELKSKSKKEGAVDYLAKAKEELEKAKNV
jgi:hypothetical protein